MDKLQAMEVFVGVVETGGITRSADRLHMPKATAATLIQKLEATLGVKLLNRTTRRVSVTPDGAAYYERCISILAEVRETEESLAKQQSTPRGRVRVDVPTLMARSVSCRRSRSSSSAIRRSTSRSLAMSGAQI